MPRNRKPLPALDNASKVNNPDLPNIYDRNYTDIILKYGGLATRFPQLNTNAKTVVAAINELQAGGQGDGKHRTLTLAEYDALSEEEKNNGTIYFITDAPSVYIRPEDLATTDALPGQLLAFYSDYGDYGVWTATSQIRNLQEGDVLLWDSQHQTWINGQISVGKSALKDLTDVDINTVLNNQILKYDETSHKWVNADNTSGVDELSELEDVNLGNLQSGQVLTYIGDYWVNSDFNLSDIEDVNITNPQNSQVLKYNSLTQTWVNADDSGDVSELADLDDVELSTPQENQILRYTRLRGSNQSYYYRWVNTNFPDTYMSDIEDVYLTSLQNYQILQYDTNNWRNIDFTLSNLQDTAISNPTNGQYLIYDGTNWVNADGGGGGGASSLSELNDVDLDESTLTEGQLLYYNGAEWVNYEYFALSIGQYGPEDGDILVYVKEDEDAPGVWQNFSIADAIELSKLGDVVIDDSDLQSGQVLTYNGSEWVNASGGGGGGATYLYELDDVNISSATDGQVLTYDSNSGEWVNESLPSIPEDITDLSDVSVTSASNGQVLKYNNGTWENANETTGSTVSVTQIQSTGTKIATITVDSVDTDLYAPSSGGGGTLTAEELTMVQYEALPTSDKLDPDVLHFINDSTTTALDVSNYVTKNENSMSITADTVDDTLIFAWNGGSNIGASAVYSIAIPSTVDKIRFKITTGTSYSTSNDRFKVGIGVKSTYTPASFVAPNDNDWLAVKIFATNNSVFEDELDLSSISTNSYLYVCGHGWNMTVNSVVTETSSEETKLLYKDFNYTGSGGSSVSALDDLSDVDITSASSGDILTYDGSDWVNDSISVSADDVSYDNTDSGLTATNVQDAIDEVSQLSIPWKDIIGTLEAGQTSITLIDISITSTSVIEIFTDSDVDYNSVTVTSGAVTVTFDEQPTNIQVMARITSVNASSITYNIDLSQYVTNKIWYRSDYQSSSSDTSLGINVQGSDSQNAWTSGATVCIDLNEFTIPASFTKMIIYISAWSATGHSGIFAVSHNTKYEATTSNTSDAILRDTRLAYPYIDSNYGTVSETDVVYEISCVPSNFGRYLYIYVGDGLAAEQTSGYNNSYNGTFNATFAGIRFI